MDFSDLVEPLGGKYADQFWLPSEKDLTFVEETIGFELPASYKQLVSEYGCSSWDNEESQIWYVWKSDEFQKPENNIDIFYGANTPSGVNDIVAGASNWLEGKPLLEFATANFGDSFYLGDGGAVYFEPPQDFRFPRGPTRKIAETFDQFLKNLETRKPE